jgi:hypothetical protein
MPPTASPAGGAADRARPAAPGDPRPARLGARGGVAPRVRASFAGSPRGPLPLFLGRQALALRAAVRRGLIPVDAVDRVVASTRHAVVARTGAGSDLSRGARAGPDARGVGVGGHLRHVQRERAHGDRVAPVSQRERAAGQGDHPALRRRDGCAGRGRVGRHRGRSPRAGPPWSSSPSASRRGSASTRSSPPPAAASRRGRPRRASRPCRASA